MKSIFFAVFLTLTTGAWCQTTMQDFSKGFELLTNLGMPPLNEKAIWAKVVDSNMMDYQIRNYTRSIKGNGWLLPNNDGTVRCLTFGSMTATELEKGATQPHPQDLDKDVESIISALQKTIEKKSPDAEFRESGNEIFLLFAVQLHQAGKKNLANRLANATFPFFLTRESAVDAVIQRMAEHRHQQVVSTFFENGNWSEYQRALTTLAEQFPRGWQYLPAVRMMLPQLTRQANGEAPPEPTLKGIPLDPRAVSIVRDLMKPPAKNTEDQEKNATLKLKNDHIRMLRMQSMGYDYDSSNFIEPLWLLTEVDIDETQPLSRLAGLKMAALPVLASLVNDLFFTQTPNFNSGGRYSFSNESQEEQAILLYRNLERPATRGEIATHMLALTLPDPENDITETDPETIREKAIEFWKTHQNASREDLAVVFLKEGSHQQISVAAEILAKSKKPEAYQIFETHVLAADQAFTLFQSVATYLKERKSEGKPFFEKYEKLLRQQIADMADDNQNEATWMIEQEGGLDKILKQLQAIADGESPLTRAIRIANEDPKTASTSLLSLMDSIRDAAPEEQLTALVTGAHTTQNEEVRAHFLGAISQIEWNSDANENEENESNQRALRPVSEKELEMWKTLIADKRPLHPSSRIYNIGNQFQTMSDLACATFDLSVTGHVEFRALIEAMPLLARPMVQVISERANALLEGKPVAPLPDATKVSKERLSAIVAEAGKKSAADLHNHLLTLTPDERAAWSAWLAEPNDIPIPDTVTELRHQIIKRSISSPYGTPDMQEVGGFDVGFRVTMESVEQHIQSLAAAVERHSRGIVFIQNADFGPGLQVSAFTAPLPNPKNDENAHPSDPYRMISAERFFRDAVRTFESEADIEALILSQIFSHESGSGVWIVKDGKATQMKSEDQQSNFYDVLRSTTESKEIQRFALNFRIITRADAEKINSQNE